MKALEKNPADRYATAKELAEDLERFVKDEPIRARRPSLARRPGGAGRHKAVVWSAAVVAMVLAASVGYVLNDDVNRLAKIMQQVEVALGGARTAIVANDLDLAHQRVVEAQAHLEAARDRLPGLGADTERILKEIKGRQADEARLRQFVKLASDAQDKMSLRELLERQPGWCRGGRSTCTESCGQMTG